MSTLQFPQQSTKGWRYSFRESTWITAAWNWLSTLVNRAAEPILLICMLYSVASITPGVLHFSSVIDGIVTLIQTFTQDIAGVGMMKLASRANLDKESPPYKLGQWMVRIMIASLILAAIKHLLNISDTEPWLLGVEVIFIVIRAVMAVQYGPKIHELDALLAGHEADLSARTQNQDELTILLKQASAQNEKLQNAFDLKLQLFQNDLQNTFNLGLQSLSNSRVEGQIEASIEGKLKVIEGQLEGVIEGLSTLSILPELKVKIEQVEGRLEGEVEASTEGVSGKVEGRVEGLSEDQSKTPREPVTQPLERVRKPAKPASKNRKELQPEPSKALSISADQKKNFIFKCLAEDPNMTIVEIRERAIEALSITLSDGSISGYRKTFNSLQLKVKIEQVEGRLEGEVEASTEGVSGKVEGLFEASTEGQIERNTGELKVIEGLQLASVEDVLVEEKTGENA